MFPPRNSLEQLRQRGSIRLHYLLFQSFPVRADDCASGAWGMHIESAIAIHRRSPAEARLRARDEAGLRIKYTDSMLGEFRLRGFIDVGVLPWDQKGIEGALYAPGNDAAAVLGGYRAGTMRWESQIRGDYYGLSTGTVRTRHSRESANGASRLQEGARTREL